MLPDQLLDLATVFNANKASGLPNYRSLDYAINLVDRKQPLYSPTKRPLGLTRLDQEKEFLNSVRLRFKDDLETNYFQPLLEDESKFQRPSQIYSRPQLIFSRFYTIEGVLEKYYLPLDKSRKRRKIRVLLRQPLNFLSRILAIERDFLETSDDFSKLLQHF